jgi:BirA family biotin operon repressor/biotin-[acetyl-CoA-carboxylase] ligase
LSEGVDAASRPPFPDGEAFRAALPVAEPPRRFVFLQETASTQDIAFDLAAEGAPDGSVALAASQTAGRGRLGREWTSPAGAGLWFSRVVRPARPSPDLCLLVAATALAVAEAVEEATGVVARLRWPNDLLVGDRKLAGILLDARDYRPAEPLLVLGIGINLAQRDEDFPEAIRGTAISLAGAGGGGDPVALFAACLRHLDGRLADALDPEQAAALDAAYGARAALLGCAVTLLEGDQRRTGVIERVSPRTGVHLRAPDGAVRVVRPELARELRASPT